MGVKNHQSGGPTMIEIRVHVYAYGQLDDGWIYPQRFAEMGKARDLTQKMWIAQELYEAAKSALSTLSELIDEQDDTIRKAADERVLHQLQKAVTKAELKS